MLLFLTESRFLDSLTSKERGICLSLLLSLLYLVSILVIKLFYVIIRDLLALSLIISTPKNSFISPKLEISNLEILERSLYRLSTSLISFVNTSISSMCVASIIEFSLFIKTLLLIFRLINPSFSNILVKYICYCLLACFRP
jgi:hypothetical protein